jgi:hypothetical protein
MPGHWWLRHRLSILAGRGIVRAASPVGRSPDQLLNCVSTEVSAGIKPKFSGNKSDLSQLSP